MSLSSTAGALVIGLLGNGLIADHQPDGGIITSIFGGASSGAFGIAVDDSSCAELFSNHRKSIGPPPTRASFRATRKDERGWTWLLAANANGNYTLTLKDNSALWVGTERGKWCILFDGTYRQVQFEPVTLKLRQGHERPPEPMKRGRGQLRESGLMGWCSIWTETHVGDDCLFSVRHANVKRLQKR